MMGRHPGDLITALMATTTASSSQVQELQLKDLLDPRLPFPTVELAEVLAFLVNIALECTRADPASRPTMESVAQQISARSQAFFYGPLGTITKKPGSLRK
ncbi:hypothetical protein ACLOJK_007864 [Asimina triloba]